MRRPDRWSIPDEERPLLCTAAMLLVLSRMSLPVVGREATERLLGTVARWLPPFGKRPEPDQIAWATEGVARRLPLSTTCLMQALAGQSLFDAHGHQSVVRFGVSKDADELRAHAWVEHGEAVVIGELDDLCRYRPLTASDLE